MTETTHTLLEDAASLLEQHEEKGVADLVRRRKRTIPDVPLSVKEKPGPKISDIFQAMADDLNARHHFTTWHLPSGGAVGGEVGGQISGMEHRERDTAQAAIYATIAKVHRSYGQ
jgi:hypothetical protein